jgi:hypothetical protein
MEEELFLDQFIRRVAYGRNIKKLDSFGIHAGSPTYLYCEHCGVPTEAFPEKPIFPTNSICSQCSFLVEKNVIKEAKGIAQRIFGD